MTPRFLIRAGVAGVLGLLVLDMAACGKQGVLDRPGPLFGPGSGRVRTPQDDERKTANAERTAAKRAQGDASESAGTSQTNGDYTQASDGAKDPALVPFRTNPPPGAPNPAGTSPTGGVIPNPFDDPNRVPR